MKPIDLVAKAYVNGSRLVLTFKAKANTKGLKGKRFRILLNGQRVAHRGKPRLSRNRRKFELSLASTTRFGDTLLLSYRDPKGDQSLGVIQNRRGRDQKTLKKRSVTNLTADTTPPPPPAGVDLSPSSASTSTTTVTFAVTPASVTEDGATNLLYTFTRTGPTTNPLTVNYTVGGSATGGSDFTTTGNTGNSVTFAAGSATATLTVDPAADTTVEPDETVALTLASGSGFAIGTPGPVTATITNDDTAAGTTSSILDRAGVNVTGTLFNDNQALELGMAFNASQAGKITQLKYYRAAADANDTDTRDLRLWRRSDGALLASTSIASAPGQSGWQRAALSTPVSITAGEQYIVSYRTNNNYLSTSNFFSPTNELSFDGLDNDAYSDPLGILNAPQNGTIANGVYRYGAEVLIPNQTFGAINYWVDIAFVKSLFVFSLSSNDLNIISESEGGAELTALRTGSEFSAAATLQYTTNEIVGSAISGVDFTPPNTVGQNTGVINFSSGDSQKTFTIPVINDDETEINELLTVGIQSPSAGSLGAPRTARILIVDDDGPSRISLAETSLNVSESDGVATVTVLRSGNRSQQATVQLVTNSGSATAGGDYETVSTTVTFSPGSYVQTVNLPIVDDAAIESRESFQVTLSNPAGASLQSNAAATVSILDNDDALNNLQRQTFVSGLNSPTTFDWLPGGSTMLVAEKRGKVQVVTNGVLRSIPLIDLSAEVNNIGDRGLLGLAVHPEFDTVSPYVYVAYTYDPPETAQLTGLAGRDGRGNRPAKMEKLTVDPNTLTVTAREVILGKNSLWEYTSSPDLDSTGNIDILPSGIVSSAISQGAAIVDVGYQDNIPSLNGIQNQNIRDYLATDNLSHTIGDVDFGPDGMLYVTVGDGTSYNFADPRSVRVQDIANLSGKMLRLDPLTGQGLADNPYFNDDPTRPYFNADLNSNQSKVFYSGLRNSFRFSFDPLTDLPVIGDVGWNSFEEINTAAAGANFGWPYFEGTSQTGRYSALDSAQAFYANGTINAESPSDQPAVFPLLYFSHRSPDDFASITVGDFYTDNSFIFSDLFTGRMFTATLDADRRVVASSLSQFDTGAPFIVDIKLGPDGFIYGSSFTEGIIRWLPTPHVSPLVLDLDGGGIVTTALDPADGLSS